MARPWQRLHPPQLQAHQLEVHLLAHLPAEVDDQALAQQGWARHQLILRPLSAHSLAAIPPRGWLLGYAGVAEAEITRAVDAMAVLLGQ